MLLPSRPLQSLGLLHRDGVSYDSLGESQAVTSVPGDQCSRILRHKSNKPPYLSAVEVAGFAALPEIPSWVLGGSTGLPLRPSSSRNAGHNGSQGADRHLYYR